MAPLFHLIQPSLESTFRRPHLICSPSAKSKTVENPFISHLGRPSPIFCPSILAAGLQAAITFISDSCLLQVFSNSNSIHRQPLSVCPTGAIPFDSIRFDTIRAECFCGHCVNCFWSSSVLGSQLSWKWSWSAESGVIIWFSS